MAQVLAIVLCAFGVLLRPNALIPAPILGAYIAWPIKVYWKRAAVAFVPAMVLFFLLVQFVYYGVLGVTRQHPLQSIMVFDLGGISRFTGQNQFPVTWILSESKLLLEGCYRPTEWDIYWRLEPCEFVMRKLERDEKIFGTRAVVDAWTRAVFRHPIAYLEHRAGFHVEFSHGCKSHDVGGRRRTSGPGGLYRSARLCGAQAYSRRAEADAVVCAGTWFVACIALCGFAWRRRETAEGAFAIGLCGTAAMYVATFFAVGVASDFRYGYLAVLATIAGGVALLAPTPRPVRTGPR